MLRRVLPAAVLLVAGVPMLSTVESAPVGILLVVVGLAVLVLPEYLRRSRTG